MHQKYLNFKTFATSLKKQRKWGKIKKSWNFILLFQLFLFMLYLLLKQVNCWMLLSERFFITFDTDTKYLIRRVLCVT